MPAQVHDLQVGAYGFRQHPHAGGQVIRLLSQPLGAGSKRIVAVATPEIEFIGKIHPEGVGGQVQTVRQFDAEVAVHVFAQPDFVQLRGNARVGGYVYVGDVRGRLQQRQRGGLDDAFPRPGLLDPGNRLGQVEVGVQGRFDYPVQDRVGKRLPPLQGLVGTGVFGSGKLVRQRRNRVFSLGSQVDQVHFKGAGGDEAAGGGGKQQCQNSPG